MIAVHGKRGVTGVDEAKKKLCQQLGIVDDSLGFLLLIIGATLLSYWAVVIQRRGLCLTIQGKTEEAGRLPDVYPLRHKASAIIVGALGFLEEAEAGDDCVAKRSARTNLWASLFVLVAGILRFQDLESVNRCQPTLTQDETLPD